MSGMCHFASKPNSPHLKMGAEFEQFVYRRESTTLRTPAAISYMASSSASNTF